MIQDGWKRDVCPNCHMPGRLGERFEKAATFGRLSTHRIMLFQGPEALPLHVFADVCDNCGTVYAYECKRYAQPPPNVTTSDLLTEAERGKVSS